MRGHARVLSIAAPSGLAGSPIVVDSDGSGVRVLHPTAPGRTATSDITEPVPSPTTSCMPWPVPDAPSV